MFPRGLHPNFKQIRNPLKTQIRNASYRRFNNSPSLLSPSWYKNPKNQKILGGGVIVFGMFYVSNLEQAPVTKRNRFMIISPAIEKKIGDYSYQQILSETQNSLLPQNHPITVKVKNIMSKLIAAGGSNGEAERKLLDQDWKIHIVNDPKQPPNAFILPGGKVFVFSSILNICQNEDGLATVLSHELSHQLARHNAENLSKAPFYFTLNLIMYTITGSDVFNSLLLNTLVKMPASREMETEADYIGLMTMSKACYNPNEAIKLWERMKSFQNSQKNGKVPEFLSTHPDDDRRIENMKIWMPEAERIRENSGCYDGFSGFASLIGESKRPGFWEF